MAGAAKLYSRLLDKLAHKADVELVFQTNSFLEKRNEDGSSPRPNSDSNSSNLSNGNNGSSKYTLQINSSLLITQSSVLEDMLEVAFAKDGDSNGLRQVPISGTSREDFVTLLAFLYPAQVSPAPEVSWDNAEVLLVEGYKWDMQLALVRAQDFIKANASTLEMEPHHYNQWFVFKWLQLSDQAGLTGACNACIQRVIDCAPDLCTSKRLEGLSPRAMIRIIDGLVQGYRLKRCSNCCSGRVFDEGDLCTTCHMLWCAPGSTAVGGDW